MRGFTENARARKQMSLYVRQESRDTRRLDSHARLIHRSTRSASERPCFTNEGKVIAEVSPSTCGCSGVSAVGGHAKKQVRRIPQTKAVSRASAGAPGMSESAPYTRSVGGSGTVRGPINRRDSWISRTPVTREGFGHGVALQVRLVGNEKIKPSCFQDRS